MGPMRTKPSPSRIAPIAIGIALLSLGLCSGLLCWHHQAILRSLAYAESDFGVELLEAGASPFPAQAFAVRTKRWRWVPGPDALLKRHPEYDNMAQSSCRWLVVMGPPPHILEQLQVPGGSTLKGPFFADFEWHW